MMQRHCCAMLGWAGKVMNELETERSAYHSAIFLFTLFVRIVVFAFSRVGVKFSGPSAIAASFSEIMLTFFDFILAIFCLTILIPAFWINHNHSSTVHVRVGSLIYTLVTNGLSIWILPQIFPGGSDIDIFVKVVVFGTIAIDIIFCFTAVLGPEKNISMHEFYLPMRMAHVRKLLFPQKDQARTVANTGSCDADTNIHAERSGGIQRASAGCNAPNGSANGPTHPQLITCYDGTTHATSLDLLQHMRTVHHCTDEELMDRPLRVWTIDHIHHPQHLYIHPHLDHGHETPSRGPLRRKAPSGHEPPSPQHLSPSGVNQAKDPNKMEPRPSSSLSSPSCSAKSSTRDEMSVYDGLDGMWRWIFHRMYPDMVGIDDSTFYYPNMVLFITGTAVMLVLFSAIYFRNLVASTDAYLNSLVSELETCGGQGVCQRVVDVASAAPMGFFPLAGLLVLAPTMPSEIMQAVLVQEAMEVNATLAAFHVTGSESGSDFQSSYPSNPNLVLNLTNALSSYDYYVNEYEWSFSVVSTIYSELSLMSPEQFGFLLDFPNGTDPAVNQTLLINALAQSMNAATCSDLVLSTQAQALVSGSCQYQCTGALAVQGITVGYVGSCLFWRQMLAPLKGSAQLSTVLSVILAMAAIAQNAFGFKHKAMLLRTGKAQFNTDRKELPASLLGRFLGTYLSCLATGVILIWLSIFIFSFLLWWPFSQAVIWKYNGVWLSWILPSIVLLLWQQCIWTVAVTEEGVIKDGQVFTFLNLALQYSYCPLAALQAMMRICYLLLFMLFCVMRIDMTLFPKGIKIWDSPHNCMLATILLYENSTNPIVCVFTHFLINDCTKNTARTSTNKYKDVGDVGVTVGDVFSSENGPHGASDVEGEDKGSMLKVCTSRSHPHHGDDGDFVKPVDEEVGEAVGGGAVELRTMASTSLSVTEAPMSASLEGWKPSEGWRRARNRWHLAVMLHRNPSLIRLRKSKTHPHLLVGVAAVDQEVRDTQGSVGGSWFQAWWGDSCNSMIAKSFSSRASTCDNVVNAGGGRDRDSASDIRTDNRMPTAAGESCVNVNIAIGSSAHNGSDIYNGLFVGAVGRDTHRTSNNDAFVHTREHAHAHADADTNRKLQETGYDNADGDVGGNLPVVINPMARSSKSRDFTAPVPI